MTAITAVEIKDLPLEDLRRIIELRAPDISVYIGIHGRVCLSSEVDSVCMNGDIVQINLETSGLSDVMCDEAFQYAFEGDTE